MKDLIEHINRCKIQALKNHINANMIIIDKEIAMANCIYYPTAHGSVNYIPSMIMGMRVDYEKNLRDEYGFNFVISESHIETTKPSIKDFSTDELLEELRRRTKDDED